MFNFTMQEYKNKMGVISIKKGWVGDSFRVIGKIVIYITSSWRVTVDGSQFDQ